MPRRPERAPIHLDSDGRPVTPTARTASGRPRRTREAKALRQPANGGGFAPTAKPGAPQERQSADALHQPANGGCFAPTAKHDASPWDVAISELVSRARHKHDEAVGYSATQTAGMWNIIARWLENQRDDPPREA